MLTLITHAIYLIVSICITVGVGRALNKNGKEPWKQVSCKVLRVSLSC